MRKEESEMNPGFWTRHLRLWCHFMKWEVKEGEK